MSQLRALVTGGCGFVGLHFVNKLLNLDYHVTIVDNLSSGVSLEAWPEHLAIPPGKRRNVGFHLADIRSFCREVSPSFDLIVHLAGVVGGRMTIARVGDCSRMFQFYVPKVNLEQGLARAFDYQIALTR